MKKTVIVRTEELRARVFHLISSIPLDVAHEVIIKPFKESRSLRQNSLYWKWITIIAADLGDTKEDRHLDYKKRFLVPIFIRDDPDYAEMVEAVRNVWRSGMKDQARLLEKVIIKRTSTTDANTAQMAEYMRDIDMEASGLGIYLLRPDDPADLEWKKAA